MTPTCLRGLQFGDLASLDDAYVAQFKLSELRKACGERRIGYKAVYTSAAVRAKLKMQELVYGVLWKGEERSSIALLRLSDLRTLAIEGELGCTLVSTKGPVCEWFAAIEPVVELHHYEFDGSVEH